MIGEGPPSGPGRFERQPADSGENGEKTDPGQDQWRRFGRNLWKLLDLVFGVIAVIVGVVVALGDGPIGPDMTRFLAGVGFLLLWSIADDVAAIRDGRR